MVHVVQRQGPQKCKSELQVRNLGNTDLFLWFSWSANLRLLSFPGIAFPLLLLDLRNCPSVHACVFPHSHSHLSLSSPHPLRLSVCSAPSPWARPWTSWAQIFLSLFPSSYCTEVSVTQWAHLFPLSLVFQLVKLPWTLSFRMTLWFLMNILPCSLILFLGNRVIIRPQIYPVH